MNSIFIVCDDPGHTRGKIARFGRLEARRLFPRASTIKSGHPVGDTDWTWHNDRDVRHYRHADGSETHTLTCQLCGRSPEVSDDTLIRLLDAAAAQGTAQITLRLLDNIK